MSFDHLEYERKRDRDDGESSWDHHGNFDESEIGDESSSEEEGDDWRNDSEKEEDVEELEEDEDRLKDEVLSSSVPVDVQLTTAQVLSHQMFKREEARSGTMNNKGKLAVPSYSNTKLKPLKTDAAVNLNLRLESGQVILQTAEQICREMDSNKVLFTGESEARQRIDIDTVIRLVFKDTTTRNVQFEIEGSGTSFAGGKIDYIVSIDGQRIGIIEAKRDASTMDAAFGQVSHEMMASTSLKPDATSPTYMFGILTDGREWKMYISDHKTIRPCGTYYSSKNSGTAVNDVAQLVAALRVIVLRFHDTCESAFVKPLRKLQRRALQEHTANLASVKRKLDQLRP